MKETKKVWKCAMCRDTRLNTIKTEIILKGIYRVNGNPLKRHADFFVEINLILRNIQKYREH